MSIRNEPSDPNLRPLPALRPVPNYFKSKALPKLPDKTANTGKNVLSEKSEAGTTSSKRERRFSQSQSNSQRSSSSFRNSDRMSADLDKGRSPAAKTQGKAEDAAEQALLAAVHSGKTQAQHLDEPLAHPQTPVTHFTRKTKTLLKMPKFIAKMVGGKIQDARGQMMFLQPKHMKLLTTEAIKKLTNSDIGYLSELRLKALSQEQLDALTSKQLEMFEADQLRHIINKLPGEEIIQLLKRFSNQDKTSVMEALSKSKLNEFDTSQMKEYLLQQLELPTKLTTTTLEKLNKKNIDDLPASFLGSLLTNHDRKTVKAIAVKIGHEAFIDKLLSYKPNNYLANPPINGVTLYLASSIVKQPYYTEDYAINEKIETALHSIFKGLMKNEDLIANVKQEAERLDDTEQSPLF